METLRVLPFSAPHPKSAHAPLKECGRYFFDPPKKYPKKCPLVSEAADPSAQEPYSGFLGISALMWARLSARSHNGPSSTKARVPLPAGPSYSCHWRCAFYAGPDFKWPGVWVCGRPCNEAPYFFTFHYSLLLRRPAGPPAGPDLKWPGAWVWVKPRNGCNPTSSLFTVTSSRVGPRGKQR